MAPGSSSSTDTYLVRAVCGGLSSMTAEIFTFPIDTIKIRLQLHKRSSLDFSAIRMVQTMLQTEGSFSLWKGVNAALARQAVYSSARMAMYEPIRNVLGSSETIWNKILAGGVGGALGAAIANPTDIIKVRLQADTTGKLYSGVLNALAVIVRTEGIRGLIKGIAPNTQRAFLVNAAELSTYDHVKQHLKGLGYFQEGVLLHGLASFGAGFTAACASTPADVIKTRMMQQPFGADGKGLLYSGTIDCVKKTIGEDGLGGLYKGFFPTWLRIGPWAMIMFISFEKFRNLAV